MKIFVFQYEQQIIIPHLYDRLCHDIKKVSQLSLSRPAKNPVYNANLPFNN